VSDYRPDLLWTTRRVSPEPGETWIRRKTGERFEVWGVSARWVDLYPHRPGNRRPIDVITHNFLQEFEPEDL
jgi:hypothetical protein